MSTRAGCPRRKQSSGRWPRAKSGDCVVSGRGDLHRQPALGGQHPDDQRRGTPPAHRHRDRRGADGAAAGVVSRPGPRRPDRGRRAGGRARGRREAPAEDAADDGCAARSALTARTGLGRGVCADRDRGAAGLRRGARRDAARGAGGRPQALRVRRASGREHLSRHLDGAAAAVRPADRADRAERASPRTWPARPGPARPPATSPTWTSRPWTPGWRSGWTGPAHASSCPPGRYETLLPPTAVSDLLVYLYWSAGAKDAAEGRTVFSKPGGGTRIGERLSSSRSRCPATRRTRDGMRAVRDRARAGADSSVFDNGLPLGTTPWISDGSLGRLLSSRHSAAAPGVPVTPAIDNLTFATSAADTPALEQMIASTERGAPAHLPVVHPRGRPADAAAHRAHPGRGLPGRERRGDRRGEQFQVQRVAGGHARPPPRGGATEPTLPREWGDYFNRAAMPPVRVDGFNMSSVSQAS